MNLDLQNQKVVFSLITVEINEHPSRKIVYRSDLQTIIFACFPWKSLNYRAIKLVLQKLSTWTSLKFTTSVRTDNTLQKSVKNFQSKHDV